MAKWLVNSETFKFDYSDAAVSAESRRNELHNDIARRGQDGWEPWHIAAFVLGYVEHVTVWFKKTDDSDARALRDREIEVEKEAALQFAESLKLMPGMPN